MQAVGKRQGQNFDGQCQKKTLDFTINLLYSLYRHAYHRSLLCYRTYGCPTVLLHIPKKCQYEQDVCFVVWGCILVELKIPQVFVADVVFMSNNVTCFLKNNCNLADELIFFDLAQLISLDWVSMDNYFKMIRKFLTRYLVSASRCSS